MVDGNLEPTEKSRIEVLPAKPEDLETVLNILEEAAHWTTSRGLAGWRPGSFSRQRIADQISCGEVFLARQGSEVVGTITLQWGDNAFWGDRPPDAGYVHKLAVRREFSGMGIGVEILRWAENRVVSSGRKHIRLNCMADNRTLRDFYERLGFQHMGDISEPRGRASLYEKTLDRRLEVSRVVKLR